MNQFDFYDDELKKKEEEEARLRNAQQPPYGAGGGYYASGQVPDGNGAPYYTDGGDGNMNNGFGGGYYAAPPVPPQRSKSKKALWITLGCILLVVIFFVGYVVGHDVVRSDISILQTVLDTVEESSLYYDSSNWEAIKRQMIVNGGTAMLQTIDGYGFLLSPAEYYTLLNPTATDTASYGMSYVKIDVGLYVHYVEYGSGAYLSGLQSGDLIIAATPLNGKKYDMRTSTDAEISQAFSGGWNSACTVDVIRNLYTVSLGDTVSVTQISMKKVEYGGQFVEYYFGRGNTNLPNEWWKLSDLTRLIPQRRDISASIPLKTPRITTVRDMWKRTRLPSSGRRWANSAPLTADRASWCSTLWAIRAETWNMRRI